MLDIDLGGVLNLARAAVPALLRRPEPRSGRFLAVASAAATRGLPMLAAYCAAKAGRRRADPGAGRRAWPHRSHRQRGQPGLDGDARCSTRARGCTAWPGRRTSPAAAGRAAARPGRGRGRARLPGRTCQQRHDRRGRSGRRRPGAVTPAMATAATVTAARHPRASRRAAAARLRRRAGSRHQAAERRIAVRRITGSGACGLPPAGLRGAGRTARRPGPLGGGRRARAAAHRCRAWRTRLRRPAPTSLPRAPARLDVTIVIPVRDRSGMLDRCLTAAGRPAPGHGRRRRLGRRGRDRGAWPARHGADVRRRAASGGPAAARNTGLAGIRDRAGRFLRQRLCAAAGLDRRARGASGRSAWSALSRRGSSRCRRSTAPARYEQARGSLDLGDAGRPGRAGQPGRVRADRALLVRRSALGRAVESGRRRPGCLRSGAAVRRGRRPDLAAARRGLADPVRAVGPGAARQPGWLARPARPPVPLRHLGRPARAPPSRQTWRRWCCSPGPPSPSPRCWPPAQRRRRLATRARRGLARH